MDEIVAISRKIVDFLVENFGFTSVLLVSIPKNLRKMTESRNYIQQCTFLEKVFFKKLFAGTMKLHKCV